MIGKDTPSLDVLLVEDNPGDVAMIEDALGSAAVDCTTTVLARGEDALAYLGGPGDQPAASRSDLVILDDNLPSRRGTGVLAELGEDRSLATVPVIVLSGSATDEAVTTSYERGANAYLVKPVDPDAYISVVQSIADLWATHGRLPDGR